MKKIISLFIVLSLFNCSPEDCFESTGTIIQQEIEVPVFDKINVGEEVTLIIKQGDTQKIVVETGSNLIDAVAVNVIDGKLFLKDENTCNFTRDYAVTKVYVTTPNIDEIRSNTARSIMSDGILYFPKLALISEDFNEDALNIGDFNLHINNENLNITSNGSSIFKIKGVARNLRINFYAGTARFEGSNLIATNISIIQKSTNDMLVNPQIKIEGAIYSIGNVISYNQPATIDVIEHYTGHLIFN